MRNKPIEKLFWCSNKHNYLPYEEVKRFIVPRYFFKEYEDPQKRLEEIMQKHIIKRKDKIIILFS